MIENIGVNSIVHTLIAQSGATSQQGTVSTGNDISIDSFISTHDAKIKNISNNKDIPPPEKQIVIWLLKQNVGQSSLSDLPRALQNWNDKSTRTTKKVPTQRSGKIWDIRNIDLWRARKFWKAKIALRIINDITKMGQANILYSKPFGLNRPTSPLQSIKELKTYLFKEISSIIKDAKDPLIMGQYYFQQALLAKEMNKDKDATNLFDKAKIEFKKVIDKPNQTTKQIAWRLWGNTTTAKSDLKH